MIPTSFDDLMARLVKAARECQAARARHPAIRRWRVYVDLPDDSSAPRDDDRVTLRRLRRDLSNPRAR